MKEEERKRKGKVKTAVSLLNFFLSVLFTFFMILIYSMSVDNAVEAVVSDHLRNSKKCSYLELIAYENGLS